MRIKWLYRHPRTRLIAGFSLHLLCSIVMGSIIASGLGFVAGCLSIAAIALYTGFDRIIVIRKRNDKEKTTERNNAIFEKGKGAALKTLITTLSRKLGITTPALEHDKNEFAMAQTWPYQRKILVNDGMFLEPEDIQQSVLAHELSHIYHNDQIKLELSCFMQLFQIGGCFVFTPLLLIIAALQNTLLQSLPLCFGMVLCAVMSQLAAGIIIRATETQADLTGCESLEDPNISYRAFTIQGQDEKPVYDSFKNYFNSWLAPHPSDWERKEDIALQYPNKIKALI